MNQKLHPKFHQTKKVVRMIFRATSLSGSSGNLQSKSILTRSRTTEINKMPLKPTRTKRRTGTQIPDRSRSVEEDILGSSPERYDPDQPHYESSQRTTIYVVDAQGQQKSPEHKSTAYDYYDNTRAVRSPSGIKDVLEARATSQWQQTNQNKADFDVDLNKQQERATLL